ncbi:hypothetical protein [Kitasatospora sp. GAS1066B]|uniref:hypothetical protein n=1 Tax=Kitasatospora sp. GAS1066B TaxID=3156271 RepID=UPI00351155D0
MPISPRTFHVVTCDVCGNDDMDDLIPLHDSPAEAAASARHIGWLITADHMVICRATDEEHRTAVDALLPPAPRFEVEGQLSLHLDSTT